MPTASDLHDTPLRHEEDSKITKTRLFSRLNRHKNKLKAAKTKKHSAEDPQIMYSLDNKAVKSNRSADELHARKKSAISYCSEMSFLQDYSTDAGFSSNVSSNEMSVINNFEEMEVSTATSIEDMSCKFNEEESIIMISKESHSTPRDVKAVATAVSSTPNLEILNTSKLVRSVASQTMFTLCARYSHEYDCSMKSYIVSMPGSENHLASCFSQTPPELLTSPLRSLYTNKINHLYTPVENKMKNVRKLSLRSRTMISSAIGKSKDKLPKHRSLEEKRLISNTFSLMPHPETTPPSTASTDKTIHNPFEADLSERLGKPIFSPDVFDNVVSPSEFQDSEYFRWTIEDISSINPVAIQEDVILPSDDEDPEKENQVQQEIERYFSETHLVLSPDDMFQTSQYSSQVRAMASTPRKMSCISPKNLNCVGTQTVVSIPETLPDEMESSLKTVFKVFEEDELNLSASNLRRKLFFHSEDEPPSPVRFTTYSSPVHKESWETDNSPSFNPKNNRNLTPVGNQGAISSPDMSPVLPAFEDVKVEKKPVSSCKKTLHQYFSGNYKDGHSNNGMGPIQNSTVIVQCSNGGGETATDSDSNSEPLLPSQDTGYQTEESWQQDIPSSVPASTPTHHNQK